MKDRAVHYNDVIEAQAEIIELPSNEEIEQIVQEVPFKSARIGFRKGAKMVIDKIQGGNK